MPFSVVLDTCVLYPAHLRDTFLRLGERYLYRALWSADIVEELKRNLSEVADVSAVGHLLDQMTAAFPDAEVTGYQSLINELTCDPKDRHVLAAAVRAHAAVIVTFNTTDFPDHSTEPYAIEVIHPDTFLLDLLDLAPGTVIADLSQQAAANRRSPRTLSRNPGRTRARRCACVR
ncbi:MAG: PIN domain-containing protein [Microthrixaceae bacterium]